MAFVKKFYSEYKSMNGDDYTLEFWIDGAGGGSTETKLASGGCIINYEADGDEKYSSIIASNMEIPLIVDNATVNTFITELREVYQEKEVYVYLYNDNDNSKPMWSGFILMDLSSQEDVSMPFEVKLKAVDGISLLKDHDFVRDGSTAPYDESDAFDNLYGRITYWLHKILEKTGCALTTQGASANYTYQTSVNWYNADHTGTAQTDDPLYLTQCKMDTFYTVDDEGEYSAQTYYDVLGAICRSWGMRCVYWNHTFHFVQISEYQTDESGTTAAPINIATREYYYNGGLRLTQAYIGSTQLGRYDLEFENTTTNYGLQKLAGTNYDHYPIIKQVDTNFLVFENASNYMGFPTLSPTTPTSTYVGTKSLGSYWDMDQKTGFYCDFIVRIIGGDMGVFSAVAMRTVWSIRAKAAGGSFTKMLTCVNGVYSWITYNAPTTSSNNGMIVGSIIAYSGATADQTIFNSSSLPNGVIPTDAAFSGEWEFELYTFELNGSGAQGFTEHGGVYLFGTNGGLDPLDYVNYSNISVTGPNIPNITGNFVGSFISLTTTIVGNQNNSITTTTSSNNTYIIKLDDVMWGESIEIDIPSSLRVYNGSAWLYPNYAGEWGVGTTSGDMNFVELLSKEIINNQSQSSLRMNTISALSATEKEDSGKVKFLNPISRLTDLDNKKYVMLRASLATGIDEWNGEWFEIDYNVVSSTTRTQAHGGRNTGNVQGGGNANSNSSHFIIGI